MKNMRYVGIYDIFGYLMETYGITWDRYEKIRITSYYLIQKLVKYPPIHGIVSLWITGLMFASASQGIVG